MIRQGRLDFAPGLLLAAALLSLCGCGAGGTAAEAAGNPPGRYAVPLLHAIPAGLRFDVALASHLSTETANVGDAWHGQVTENVPLDNGGQISVGSRVDGVVEGVIAGRPGSRAFLQLRVRSIHVKDYDESVVAVSEPVVAGSPYARSLSAIARVMADSSATVNAVIGKDGTSAAPLGSAPTVVTPGADGDQVVLTEGLVLSFTVSRSVAMR
jgi:hypothetical protein